jgi:2-amino-4-hydroxy-6-hydroxymethyldihydropteridine diphosphokinase
MIWKNSTAKLYVSLGSNMGDRAGNLLLGVRGMMAAGLQVTNLSSIYETAPLDFCEQPTFLNMIAELRTAIFTPEQVLARLLRIEYALGRRREIASGPRSIDLDLLLYNAELRDTAFLMLPHPRMHLRRFVLEPLAELAPELLHPTTGKTILELLDEVDRTTEVKRWG